jgi:hypothetical protein
MARYYFSLAWLEVIFFEGGLARLVERGFKKGYLLLPYITLLLNSRVLLLFNGTGKELSGCRMRVSFFEGC